MACHLQVILVAPLLDTEDRMELHLCVEHRPLGMLGSLQTEERMAFHHRDMAGHIRDIRGHLDQKGVHLWHMRGLHLACLLLGSNTLSRQVGSLTLLTAQRARAVGRHQLQTLVQLLVIASHLLVIHQ